METIGQRIKELRKKNDLTQEELADYLFVSCQAISKWECGVSSPDLSLIGPLTKLLHVTADELLGLTREVADKRYAELTAAIEETWRTGDLEERYNLLKTAVTEYPGDMKLLDEYAIATAMRAFDFEDNELYRAAQEEAIRLFAWVIENSEDVYLRAGAIKSIVQTLGFRGRYDEARQYAALYPDDLPFQKDDVMLDCLLGDERERHQQKMLRMSLERLIHTLGFSSAQSCHAVVDILMIFYPDGNYQIEHMTLSIAKQKLAEYYATEGDYDIAIRYLQEAKEHAYASDEICRNHQVYRYASLFFDREEFDSGTFFHTGDDSSIGALQEVMAKPVFDPIREREAFRVLDAELSSNM